MSRIKERCRQPLALLLLLKGFNARTSAHAVLNLSGREVSLVLALDILSTEQGYGKILCACSCIGPMHENKIMSRKINPGEMASKIFFFSEGFNSQLKLQSYKELHLAPN